MKKVLWMLVAAVAVLASENLAQAGVTYSFVGVTNNKTNNKTTDVAIGQAQLSLTVSDAGSGLVRFQFANSGPAASSITDIYFDDRASPVLFSTPIYSFDNSGGGVNFSTYASPGNLPGGRRIDFVATYGLTADSNSPTSINGVNPGESVGVITALANGHTYNDVLTSLADRSLRVGIHVQAFASGGSESFVNNGGSGPPPAIPEPSSMAILGIGLAGAVTKLRRRNQNKA